MTYQVEVLDEAAEDLWQIYGYIIEQFGDTVATQKYKNIRDGILRLEENPELGTAIPQLVRLGMTNYRHMIVEKLNRVVYEINETYRIIYVHIICSTRRDFDAVLHSRLIRP